MLIFDEYGMVWHVEAGDPARPACLLLGRLGFESIVLPRYVIRGILSPSDEAAHPIAPPPGTGAMPDIGSLVRSYRLADCLEALQ